MYAHCNFANCVSARFLLSLRACTTRRLFSWAFRCTDPLSHSQNRSWRLVYCSRLSQRWHHCQGWEFLVYCSGLQRWRLCQRWQFSWLRLLVLPEVLVSRVLVLRVLVSRVLVPGELVLGVLVLAVLLLGVLVSVVLVPGVLVALVQSKTWEYTRNDLESWDWSDIALD